jgi:polyisoprenoid-binding protein YceI
MSRSTIGWIFAFVLAIGGSALAWLWFAGGSGEPSAELTTPTIAELSTTLPESPATSQAAETVSRAYVIDASQSVAAFEIDEVLQGNPQRVVGETDQVAGQVQVNLDDPSSVQFSAIVINARTFRTDSERRDRAIRGPVILNSASDEHELITFEVTDVAGLPDVISIGETAQFMITGDLTIRGATNKATFDLEVTAVDESTLSGTATAQVLRSDFGIGIPSVPGVADVTDEVTLNLTFVALAG